MKLSLFLFIILLSVQEEIPLKPKEEFEIKLKYEFKTRATVNNHNSVNLAETVKEHERKTSTAMLPYVGLNLKLLKLQPEEVRLRIVDSKLETVTNKKVKQDDIIFIDMGFTDDMKDRTSPHEYTVNFLNSDKKELSKIIITVEKDGSFLVNNEKRGKF